MRFLSIAFAVALFTSALARASAQISSGVSFSVQVGSAKTTGGEFRETSLVDAELAGSGRLAIDPHTAVVAGVAITPMGYSGDITSLCLASRHGGCRPPSAEMTGWSFRAGVERQFFPLLSVTGLAGIGWYSYGGTIRRRRRPAHVDFRSSFSSQCQSWHTSHSSRLVNTPNSATSAARLFRRGRYCSAFAFANSVRCTRSTPSGRVRRMVASPEQSADCTRTFVEHLRHVAAAQSPVNPSSSACLTASRSFHWIEAR
jgi:hypothetical protein